MTICNKNILRSEKNEISTLSRWLGIFGNVYVLFRYFKSMGENILNMLMNVYQPNVKFVSLQCTNKMNFDID